MSGPAPRPADTEAGRLREHAAWLLEGGYAHQPFEEAVADVTPAEAGAVPAGATHSVWQIVEHLRVCQRDLIDYTTTPGHVSPAFPDGLWPADPKPPSEKALSDSAAAFLSDRAELAAMLRDPAVEPLRPLDHIDGRTLLRQALIAAEHQSYHVGQLSITRSVWAAAEAEAAAGVGG